MAFCRKNIDGLHQAARVAVGLAAVVAGWAYLTGAPAWLVALGLASR